MNIIELAKEAGMDRRPADRQCRVPYWDVVIDSELERFTALVLEEAAKVCDKRAAKFHLESPHNFECNSLADAIRALKGANE